MTDVNGWWALRNPDAATLHYYGLHEWGTITTRIERSPGFISYIRMYIEGCQVAQLLPYLLSLSRREQPFFRQTTPNAVISGLTQPASRGCLFDHFDEVRPERADGAASAWSGGKSPSVNRGWVLGPQLCSLCLGGGP